MTGGKKKSTRITTHFAEYPEWSEAKFWAFIRSGLRAKWQRWPPKYEALKAVRRAYVGPNKRQKYEFQCAKCGEWFIQKMVSVDHIEPIGTLRNYDDLPLFTRRLFVSADKLQVLCATDHQEKTNAERQQRKNASLNKEIVD